MDAKPQRPVRNLRVHDENMPLVVPGHRTIHHRNKSSPALSSFANGGGLKTAAKRTAFGDVSNTVSSNRPIKDDMAILGKTGYDVIEKAISVQHEKKANALLRPAQRPMSVSGLRNLVNGAHNGPTTRSAVSSLQPLPAPANTRKPPKKKSTIFKDQEEPLRPELLKDSHNATTSTAPVHRDLVPKHHENNTKLSEAPDLSYLEQRVVETATSTNTLRDYGASNPGHESAAVRSDGAYIDDNGNIQFCEYADETDPIKDFAPVLEDLALLPVVSHQGLKTFDARDNAGHGQQSLPLPMEPEEYWDEEEELDTENVGEEGYVTARSFKSRGDNTTGGATTILFPKVNKNIQREIAAAKTFIESTRTAEEIEDEAWDTSMVAEYGDEIFQYMKELEIKMLPNAHYMDNQAEIQWSMRSVLMDWIVQVHHRFGLLPETLFLAVNYVDRFLSCKIVSLGKLQLVGITAIFVAAKYEEINCPSVQEIVYMVDGGYTVDEILKAERFMLSMLQFELGWPGPMSFLRRISKADDYDLETRTLAKYFLEVTIMDERFIGSPPSFAAAGAHCLARMMLKKGNWSPAHIFYSNYTFAQLYSLVLLIVECCENPGKHHAAIYEKYTDKRYKRASHFVEKEMEKGFQVLDVAADKATTFSTSLYPDFQNWEHK